MRIVFLASGASIHTVRWVNALSKRGHEIHLVTMDAPKDRLEAGVVVHLLRVRGKVGYLLNGLEVAGLLKRIKPDLVHAHYASGYGTLARLSSFHPLLLSVWGSDVFEFPYEGGWKRRLLCNNLRAADRIASTSRIMKEQVEKLIEPRAPVAVTPFGVDTAVFYPKPERKVNAVTIGTVKSLAPKCGIGTLIRAFSEVVLRSTADVRLVIVGGGPQERDLRNLVSELGLQSLCQFVGPVPHAEVPKLLNTFDIYCALSESESFGVAVIEASATGLPVVVSDAGGLPEVVRDGVTGFIVRRRAPLEAADRITTLVQDAKLRLEMGRAGRQFVLDNFSWEQSVAIMEALYFEVWGERQA